MNLADIKARLSEKQLRRAVHLDSLLSAMKMMETETAKSGGKEPYFWTKWTSEEWEQHFPGKRGVSWDQLLSVQDAAPALVSYIAFLAKATFTNLT